MLNETAIKNHLPYQRLSNGSSTIKDPLRKGAWQMLAVFSILHETAISCLLNSMQVTDIKRFNNMMSDHGKHCCCREAKPKDSRVGEAEPAGRRWDCCVLLICYWRWSKGCHDGVLRGPEVGAANPTAKQLVVQGLHTRATCSQFPLVLNILIILEFCILCISY